METQNNLNTIDLVMTTWNRPLFTAMALNSIFNNTTTPHRMIVIDNGSEYKMQERLLMMKDLGMIDILVLLDKNYGLEYAKHRAMSFIDSRLFVSTDNDILAYKYEPDWLSQLVDLADRFPEYLARKSVV